ncbi:MAG: hypothetical protein Tsb0010_04930 [Parvularculaceae bacterium]
MTRSHPSRFIAKAFAVAAIWAPVHAISQPSDAGGGISVIRNVNVLPMDAPRAIEHAAVLIRDGVIAAVGPDAEITAPEDAQEINGQGGYLAPGLIDAHMHYRHDDEFLNYLAWGVTTVLGLGQPLSEVDAIRRMQAEIRAGREIGPEIYTTAGTIANHIQLETPQEGRDYVRRLAADGFDFVKIYNNIPQPVFDAVVDEAARHGLSVFGHIPRNFPTEYSLANGLDVVAHAEEFYFTYFGGPRDQQLDEFDGSNIPDLDRAQAVIDLMLAHDVALIPNLVFTYEQMKFWDDEAAVLSEPEMAFLHPSIAGVWGPGNSARRANPQKRMLRDRIKYNLIHEFTRRAHDAGVLIAAGSDAPLPGVHPGKSLHSEMREFIKSGLDDFEALAAATRDGGRLVAKYVDRQARIGQIAVGYEADLILLERNPLEDIRNSATILGVMSDGLWRPAETFDAMRRNRAARYVELRALGDDIAAAVDDGARADKIQSLVAARGFAADEDALAFAYEAVEARAFAAFQRGDLDETLRIVRLNTEAFPENPLTWETLGELLLIMENPADARAAFARALEIDPDFENARRQIEAIDAGAED